MTSQRKPTTAYVGRSGVDTERNTNVEEKTDLDLFTSGSAHAEALARTIILLVVCSI